MDRIRYLSSWSQITLLVTDEQGNAKAYTLWNGRQEPAPRFILYAASKSQTLCPGAKQIQTTNINQEHNFSPLPRCLLVNKQ